MRKDRLHRWLSALLVAPLLALAVSASSVSGLRCAMSGLFVPDGCCPTAAGAQQPAAAVPTHASLQDPACCQRVVVANAKAPAAPSPRLELAPPCVRLAGAVVLQPPAPSIPRPARPDRAGAPRGRSSPIFVLTQSFLI